MFRVMPDRARILNWARCLGWCLLAFSVGMPAVAQESYRYALGTSGLKAATVPPPGNYWLFYNFIYAADQLVDGAGNPAMDPSGQPVDFDVYAYANAHRFVFVTDHKIFGGDFSWNFAVPFVGTDLKITNYGVADNSFALGDIYLEPFVLEWHLPQIDFGVGYGLIAPTGARRVDRPSLPGKEYWTHYPVFGATYYFDEERTWTAAILGRYEVNTSLQGRDLRPGDHFNFEWGVGKTIKTLDAGVSGYCDWQVTADSGSDWANSGLRDRSFAIGPEVHYFFPEQKVGLQFRTWWEFGARDRSQGQITTLTLVKPF